MSEIKQLPELFLERMSGTLGDEYQSFLQAIRERPPVAIRLNPMKAPDVQGIAAKIPWCTDGYYLEERPRFHMDPFWHAGAYYVQDASSMFLERIFNSLELPPEPVLLDACAAPGGKSTHLLSLLNGLGLLIANEVISKRNKILVENIVRWGRSNVITTFSSIPELRKVCPPVDMVLVDAPCSGEGLFRKDRTAGIQWSEEHVLSCSRRQAHILGDVVEMIRPGGYLVYSTCTWSETENEDHIEALIQSGSWTQLEIEGEPSNGIVRGKNGLGFRFYPHRVKGEGMYFACLKKNGSLDTPGGYQDEVADVPQLDNEAAAFIDPEPGAAVVEHNNHLHLFPGSFTKILSALQRNGKVSHFGIPCGMEMKGQFRPFHGLALSGSVSPQVPVIDLDDDMAVRYLKKESPPRSAELENGWHLVRNKGITLGWSKVLTSRINNYYPKSWSIRP